MMSSWTMMMLTIEIDNDDNNADNYDNNGDDNYHINNDSKNLGYIYHIFN